MQSLNLALFEALGAGFAPQRPLLSIAAAIATGSTWLCVALLAWAAWRRPASRFHVFAALLAAAAASVIAKELAHALGMPRPFMAGLSPLHIPHGARGGMPSAHASVMFTVAFVLLLHRPLRDIGWLMAGIAVVTAWSRVHVGVHFPFDVLAGALLGAILAGMLRPVWPVLQAWARRQATPGGGMRAAEAGLAPHLAALARPLVDSRFGLGLALGCAAVAVGIGLGTPAIIPLSFLQKGGALEDSTIGLCVATALLVVAMRLPGFGWRDKLAACVLFLALAAREAELHSAAFGMRILQTHWNAPFADAGHVVATLAMLAPIALSVLWLGLRSLVACGALHDRHGWRPARMTALTFGVVIVIAEGLDRLPPMLVDAGLAAPWPPTLRYLLLSLEEVLEFALPLLALLAIAQLMLGRRDDRAPRPGTA